MKRKKITLNSKIRLSNNKIPKLTNTRKKNVKVFILCIVVYIPRINLVAIMFLVVERALSKFYKLTWNNRNNIN